MKLNQASQRIQRILRDNMFSRKNLATSGSLAFNRLASYKVSKKIFERKQADTGKLYNLELLIDLSGSMRDGGNDVAALTAAQNISKLLRHICSINITVFNYLERIIGVDELLALDTASKRLAFIRSFQKQKVWARQQWDKYYFCWPDDIGRTHRVDSDTTLSSMFHKNSSRVIMASRGNREVCNIVNAWKRIRQKDWHNIIVIVQDWAMEMSSQFREEYDDRKIYIANQPVERYTYDGYVPTLRKIEKDVELVSMGINTQRPSHFFSNFVYVSDPNDIYKNIVELFERLI